MFSLVYLCFTPIYLPINGLCNSKNKRQKKKHFKDQMSSKFFFNLNARYNYILGIKAYLR